MSINNERLAKDDALAISYVQPIYFANGQSLMHGKSLVANSESLNLNITNESRF